MHFSIFHGLDRKALTRPVVGTLIVAAIISGACARVDFLAEKAFHARQRATVVERGAALRALLEQRLNLHLRTLSAVRAVVQAQPGLTSGQFALLGALLVRESPAIAAIVLQPAQGGAPLAYRRAAFAGALPATLGGVRVQGPDAVPGAAARIVAHESIDLAQDAGSGSWGQTAAVLDYASLLAPARALLADAEVALAIRGKDGQGAAGAVFEGDAALFADRPVTGVVAFPNGSWVIAAAPKGGWDQNRPNAFGLRLFMLSVMLVFSWMTLLIGLRGARNKRLLRKLRAGESARRQWVADTSHELRTPITILATHLDAMQDGVIEASAPNLAVLSETVQGMERLVSDLHQLARSDAQSQVMELEWVDMAAMCAELQQAFAPKFAAHGLRFSLINRLPADARVCADRQRLVQVLSNLWTNSIRYTDSGGEVRVELTAAGAGVRISTDDTAPGVPDEALGRLFERFYRVDRSRSRAGGGSGLGLAICESIVQQHGGTITASHSTLGGLRIEVLLPAHPPGANLEETV